MIFLSFRIYFGIYICLLDVITIETDRKATYNTYVGVQNELMGAYYELRKELSKTKFNKEIENLTEEELKILKESYPFRITEAKLEN